MDGILDAVQNLIPLVASDEVTAELRGLLIYSSCE
jgi:hypothetical protein